MVCFQSTLAPTTLTWSTSYQKSNRQGDGSSRPFTIGNTAQERGLSCVPECYKTPSLSRPNLDPETAYVPVFDLARLRQDSEQGAHVVKGIGNACRRLGFLQVVNHGICPSIMEEAMSSAIDFFKLPAQEKAKFMSNDIYKPIRYCTSLQDGFDKVQFWRVFLKHYAHPLSEWSPLWPNNPPDYRERMGKYCTEVRKVSLEVMGLITESLGLGPAYLSKKMEDGMQVIAVNCYSPCPNPEMVLGLPPHSDYTCLNFVLQSSPGLEIMDRKDGNWRAVPFHAGALQVQVGDFLEVLSNGMHKSVVHRVTLNSERTRTSISSLYGLGMDEKVGTAEELVDDQHPKRYKASSFRDFLNFLSVNDIGFGQSFIDTLKIPDRH